MQTAASFTQYATTCLVRKAAELRPRLAAAGALSRAREEVLHRFPRIQLPRTALVVRQRTANPLASQVRGIVVSRLESARLEPNKYYAFELCNTRSYSFAGSRGSSHGVRRS